jgi:hypothetical protein
LLEIIIPYFPELCALFIYLGSFLFVIPRDRERRSLSFRRRILENEEIRPFPFACHGLNCSLAPVVT